MTTVFTDTPKIGVILTDVQEAAADADEGTNRKSHRLGSQIWDTLGRRCVYAEAGADIAANTAVVNINTTTFIAAASGGAYISPAVALKAGDRAWFAKASV